MKVLLADDDEGIRDSSERLLTARGDTVDVVTNGQELLDRLKSEKYDIVITDYHMPVMDGITALRYIRADVLHEDMPVIVLTGDPETEVEIEQEGGIYAEKLGGLKKALDELEE